MWHLIILLKKNNTISIIIALFSQKVKQIPRALYLYNVFIICQVDFWCFPRRMAYLRGFNALKSLWNLHKWIEIRASKRLVFSVIFMILARFYTFSVSTFIIFCAKCKNWKMWDKNILCKCIDIRHKLVYNIIKEREKNKRQR